MTVYILATALTCLLVWFGERRDRKWRWRFCAALPLVIVSAIRWDVGTDFYFTYYPASLAFECLKGGSSPEQVEAVFAPLVDRLNIPSCDTAAKLYDYYLGVIKVMGLGYRCVMEAAWSCGGGIRTHMAVFSVLIGTLVFVAIYRQSKWPALAAFLYVATSNYFLSLNIVRQYLAVALGLVAVEFVLRRKPCPFFACVLLGAFFHSSALVLLPLYFIGRIELRLWGYALLVLVAAAVAPFAAPVAVWTFEALGMNHYAYYFHSAFLTDGFEWFFFAINVSFLLFGGWYWRRAKEQSPYFVIWYNMTVIGTVFLALSGSFPLMKRINYYFAAPQFLLLPEILLAEGNVKTRRLLTVMAVLVFAVETSVAVWMFNKNEPLPYSITCRPGHACSRARLFTAPFGWELQKGM